MSVGFRILKRQRKVATEVVERFARLPVANVSDSMSRMTAAGATAPADASKSEGWQALR